jgi:protocatechuate 3,4-dioxygenase beta subunit
MGSAAFDPQPRSAAMRDISLDNITAAVDDSMKGAADARFREVFTGLVTHLHAFAREVHLTQDEWNAGIDFLWRAGRISDDKRNEFVLTSDVLGLSSLVDLLNGSQHGTESSVLGPFYVEGAPILPVGASIVGENSGERVLMHGRVFDAQGEPLPGAMLDFWQTDADGLYSQATPHKPEFNLRCRMKSDAQGCYAVQTVKPRYYSVPYDGPVGDLLRAGGRHALRPSHFHVLVTAPGHRRLVTEIFAEDDPYIDGDAVFGVRRTLVADFVRRKDAAAVAPYQVEAPFFEVNFDFRLDAEETAA